MGRTAGSGKHDGQDITIQQRFLRLHPYYNGVEKFLSPGDFTAHFPIHWPPDSTYLMKINELSLITL